MQNVYEYMHCVIMKLKILFYYFIAANLVACIKFCCDVRIMEPFLQLIAVILYIAEYLLKVSGKPRTLFIVIIKL